MHGLRRKSLEALTESLGVSMYGDRLHVTLTGKEISDAVVSAARKERDSGERIEGDYAFD